MSCLSTHHIRLFEGRVWAWVDHRDALVLRTLRPLKRALPKKQSPSAEDVNIVRSLEQLGKLAVTTRLTYKVLDAAYQRAGLKVRRLPHEPDDEFARRLAYYCTGEIPIITSYLNRCAGFLPQLYRPNPNVEWLRPKLEPFAEEAARSLAKWYEVCRAQE